MKKYVDLIKLLEEIFGKGSVSRTIGTRTNVVRFPKGKQPIDPTKAELNIEGVAVENPDLVQTIKNSIEDRMGDITKMNDQELLTYTANVRRLRNFENPPKLPEADVVKFGSGEEMKGEGLEKLIEKQGTRFPPTTDIGKIEAFGKKLEKFVEETSPEYLAKQEAERRAMIARQYEGKGYAGGVFGPSGEYRSVARTFLLDQNAKGKIKLNPDTVKNLEERSYIHGGQPLMYADPIRIMRYHYGDDVFEKIPLDKITTGAPSEILDVMSKVEAPPIRTEPPKTPGGYLTPGEYRANIEELKQVEDAIRRREARFADMTEEEIANELAQYGGKRSSFEMGLEFDYPEEYAKYKAPKKPEPSKRGEVVDIVSEGDKRKTIDELIDEYNANFDRTLLTDEEGGTSIGYQEFQKLQKRNEEIAKALEEKGIKSTVEEEIKPEGIVIPFRKKFTKPEPEEKSDGGRIGYNKGKRVMSQIDKLLESLNKKLSKKKSMETVDPKTGEVTISKRPIKKAEEPTGMTTMDPEPEIVDEKAITKTKKPVVRTTEDIEKEIDEIVKIPITTLEGKRKYNDLHLEFINSLDPGKKNKSLDYRRKTLDTENRLILKAEEQGLDFDTFEKLRTGLYGPQKQQTLDFIKTGKVNIEPVKSATTFEEVQKRYGTAAKAADEIFPNYDTPKTAATELAEVMAEQKYGKVFDDLSGDIQQELYEEAYSYITSVNKLPKISPKNIPQGVSEMNLEKRMNEVLNQYDKSMFVKNEQGMVDVTNPENIEKMALLLKRDHPEIYNEIFNLGEDLSQKQQLLDFDVTGRKPNSEGGIAGLL